MPKVPTLENRVSVQNWMNEGKSGHDIYQIKLSPTAPGRPREGSWTTIESASDIPSGMRWTLNRSSDDKSVFVVLPSELVGETPKKGEEINKKSFVNGEILGEREKSIEEREALAEANLRASILLSEANHKTAAANRSAAEALENAMSMAKKATDLMELNVIASSKAKLYETLQLGAMRTIDIIEVYFRGKDNPDAKEILREFLALKSHLKSRGLDIDGLSPADFATFISVKDNELVKKLISQIRQEELRKAQDGVLNMAEKEE